MKKLRIAFLIDDFPLISETFILNQITGLLDLGHEVRIFARFRVDAAVTHPQVEKYQLMERVRYYGLEPSPARRLKRVLAVLKRWLPHRPGPLLKSLNFFKYGPRALSLSLLNMVGTFLGERIDILMCHYGPNGVLATYLHELGIPGRVVTMFHGYDIRLGLSRGGDIYSPLFRHGACLLAISEYNRQKLLDFGATPGQVVRHPVGIDLEQFPFKWNDAAPREPAQPVVLISVGRFVPEKGLEHGLHAFKKIRERHPDLDLRYRLVGSGPLEPRLRGIVAELSLERVVTFLGFLPRDALKTQLVEADVFVLPSIAEILPVVIMEALAVGLPVVASDVGSVRELLHSEQLGYLVPPAHPEALAGAVSRVLSRRADWELMGREGREFIATHYDVRVLNHKLARFFVRLLEQGA